MDHGSGTGSDAVSVALGPEIELPNILDRDRYAGSDALRGVSYWGIGANLRGGSPCSLRGGYPAPDQAHIWLLETVQRLRQELE